MNMFINYSSVTGLQLSTWRNSGVSCSDDIVDFCKEVQRGGDCNFTIHDNVDYYIDGLCDGTLLDGVTQDTVEAVYNFLNDINK